MNLCARKGKIIMENETLNLNEADIHEVFDMEDDTEEDYYSYDDDSYCNL